MRTHAFLLNNASTFQLCISIARQIIDLGEGRNRFIGFNVSPEAFNSSLFKTVIRIPPDTFTSEEDTYSLSRFVSSIYKRYSLGEIYAYIPHLWNTSYMCIAASKYVKYFSYIEEGHGSSQGEYNLKEELILPRADISQFTDIAEDFEGLVEQFVASRYRPELKQLYPSHRRLLYAYHSSQDSFPHLSGHRRHVLLPCYPPPKEQICVVLLPSIEYLVGKRVRVDNELCNYLASLIANYVPRSFTILLKPHRSTPKQLLNVVFIKLMSMQMPVVEWTFFRMSSRDYRDVYLSHLIPFAMTISIGSSSAYLNAMNASPESRHCLIQL